MIGAMGPILPLACAACALALAACGGGDDDGRLDLTTPGAKEQRERPAATAEAEQQPAEAERKVNRGDVRVVRRWADALRHGDVRAASRYFALPSTVSNGTAPIKLDKREDVRFFNRTLPCGARLIATEPTVNGFFFATFLLTERPGRGSCGAGTGQTARTAFRVRDHLITDWLRVPDEEPDPSSPA
jgi:hypothetical protein